MRKKSFLSRANLFLTLSVLLMVGYVGYLFAGTWDPPNNWTIGDQDSEVEQPYIDDDGNTVFYANAYVMWNSTWEPNSH